jgi:hypothetical protein
MKQFHAYILAGATLLLASPASAQTPPAVAKMNAYAGCLNWLSARAFRLRSPSFGGQVG